MPAALTIGDFSCATHLSVKTLRHYHRVGLLAPSDVDADTRYRRYTTDQIPTAQVIRRFRDLNMPLDQIHAVLEAPDLHTRNELISAHLASLEQNLAARSPRWRRCATCSPTRPPPHRSATAGSARR